MADIIHLLPDTIANQIAAGEVIQRPASAVKELLENAVDAGADEIRLIVKEAGKSLIQVIDNGSGMSHTDARMCFEKHATSKIKKVDDLFNIRTMGFRGEAMASISAIAQVELKSRLHTEELGTQIIIEGFEVKSQEPCQTSAGTSIAVKNLFYNVPARRNFLKSNTVELRHIMDEFERIALAHPHVFFTMHHNGVEIFHLKKANLRQRIIHLFGNNYNEKLVPVEEKTSVTNLHGFIGKPENAKRTKGEQFFFVNNRFIKSNYLHHALKTAYEAMLPDGSYPLYVIFIDIDPKRIDVNVHPTKQEIKFEDERIIYTFIHAAVKHALAAYSITPTLDFEVDATFAHLPAFIRPISSQSLEPAFKTMQSKMNANTDNTLQSNLADTRNFRERFNAADTTISQTEHFEDLNFHVEDSVMHAFQVHNHFIIAQIKSGYVVVDQQAAHERILFEKYLTQLSNKKHITQQQLFPATLHTSVTDAAILNDILEDINCLGFDIQPFGKDTFVIHGVPPELTDTNEKQIIENLLEQFKQNTADLKLDKHTAIAKGMAKSNAIKSGKSLTLTEIKLLIDELFACKVPHASPDGNHTFITFGLDDLVKQFLKKN
ncbi:MAG: DNA mismatch repair endonuclease MutL [Bacteroidetes bacterium]|nr:DNA mismatch repair endonuclease MutL [Bacteroidota bacterium]MBP7398142.1 DNA mismatch repair endonuclease MutL [Chitinophagales bacterium]MBK7108150.1 DNA mismatch repair endonuclease MutL [Bacteroidota bacterium]MBK8486417.1 DNA mismatch repair endonuclease MutL [Bacteroidota bacterium]MBK8683197.1 DNA mismatch repair endonuclease MutL [Bacteroidota bacterium]